MSGKHPSANRVACSRMYDVSPRARAAWAALFRWLSDTSSIPLEDLNYPAPRPLPPLWRRNDLGCVFMCGWPFSRAHPKPLPVAAPIPRGERYHGEPIYFTDLVVRRDSGYERLEDTFGGRIGWTAEGSHSGFNALRHHLLAYRARYGKRLYKESVGPLVTPSRSLASVVDGSVDVAPLDSYAFDLIAAHKPGFARKIKIIDSTVASPIPLLVASPSVGTDNARMLSNALQMASSSDAMAPVLAELRLRGFAPVSSPSYVLLEERAQQALAASYTLPF